MALMVDGIIATGETAFRPGRQIHGDSTQSSIDSTQSGASPIDAFDLEVCAYSDMFIHKVLTPIQESDNECIGDANNSQVSALQQPATPTPSTAAITSTYASQERKRKRTTGSSAIFALSSAIDSVAGAFTSSAQDLAGFQPSPVRKKAAIKLVEDMEELSDTEVVDVVEMFRENTGIADAYLSLRKKTTRTAYLNKALEKYINKN